MTPPNGGDPGGSLGRRLPLFMDPRNEFGRITILQLTGRDGADLPMDPYLIGKSVEQLVGETAIESATSEQRGKRYTLRVRNPTHVEKLLNMSKLMDGTEVCITLHPILNVSKCTIFCSDAIRYTEEEALAKLSAQNVIKVQRITRMENGNRVNTPVLILTFNQTTYPEHVKVGLLYVPTRTHSCVTTTSTMVIRRYAFQVLNVAITALRNTTQINANKPPSAGMRGR